MPRTIPPKLSEQVIRHSTSTVPDEVDYEGNVMVTISTGSTLLDLAISGGRKYGGGLPGGIFVEIFGPPGCGKTVLLAEIAGNIQRQGGEVKFHDPEGRLNEQFSKLFLNMDVMEYTRPDKVTELFAPIPGWRTDNTKINGIIADSLAALSTDMEMDAEDKMGMRRAKEFSIGFRKSGRILANRNYLMVCSNQVRENPDAGMYDVKTKSTGGYAISHWASLRLQCYNPSKMSVEKKIPGVTKPIKRVFGIETTVKVFKSTIWKPFHEAQVCIDFDYGIDDIRANLQYVKDMTKSGAFLVRDKGLAQSLTGSVRMVERGGLVEELRDQVIEIWGNIEAAFTPERTPKHGNDSH